VFDLSSRWTEQVNGTAPRSAIEALRRDAYRRAREFAVTSPAAYAWTPSDDRATVLAIWDRDGVVATMRGTVVATCEDAEALLECTTALNASFFPALVLERGATRDDCRRQGLNSWLRWHFLAAARDAGIRSTLTAVFEEAPRARLMQTLGYVFVPPERVWDANIEVRKPLYVAHLRHEDMANACTILAASCSQACEAYPWRGPPIVLKPHVPLVMVRQRTV